MRGLKRGFAAAVLFALLACAAFAPMAFASDGEGGDGQLRASGFLTTQASNTVQADAEEIAIGGTASGEFDLDEKESTCNPYWYKFKTTNDTAGYRVKFEMLFGTKIHCSLYDEYGKYIAGVYANPTDAIIKTGLDKNTWYYAKVGSNLGSKDLRYKQFKVSVEKFDIDLAHANVTLDTSSYTYDGKVKKPNVTVELDGSTLKSGTDYSVTYANNTNPGTATVTVAGKGNYLGTKTVEFSIGKTGNTLKASGKKVTLRANANALQKKRVITKSKAFSIRGANGTVRFAKKSGNKKISVSKTGKVTVKKGLKTGTYKVKVKVKAAGDAYHNAATKTATLTVKVRK